MYKFELAEPAFRARHTAPDEGCWIWTGQLFGRRGGYGSFTCRPAGVLRVRAHRFAAMLSLGRALARDEHVLHRCDNPMCVRPDHLFLGDQASNMRDKVSKARQNHGAGHGMHKLTEREAISIIMDRRLQRIIANEYDVSVPTISDIKRGRSWKHLDRYRSAA